MADINRNETLLRFKLIVMGIFVLNGSCKQLWEEMIAYFGHCPDSIKCTAIPARKKMRAKINILSIGARYYLSHITCLYIPKFSSW